jgi:hypothetical protein
VAAALALATGCGSSVNGNPSAPAVQRVGGAMLRPGGNALSLPLPRNWVIRLRVWFPVDQSTLRLGLGSAAVMVFDGSRIWHRVEVTPRGVVVDGRRTERSPLRGANVTFRAEHSPLDIRDLVIERSAT